MADDVDHDTEGLRGRDLVGLGGMLAGSVVAFMLLGLLVDNLAGTKPVFTMVGLFVGMGFGAFGFWVRAREAMRG